MKRIFKRYVFSFIVPFIFSILHSQDFINFSPKDTSVSVPYVSVAFDTSISTHQCHYPNGELYKGKDVVPKISDNKRRDAILNLISKIVDCEKLPFKEDGQVFKNKEKKLPEMPFGYYREYTLIIPKDADKEFYVGETHFTAYPSYGARGPERIIVGGGKEIYYTPTHYDSFVKISIVKSDK